ncbi:hypothetical protein ACTXT7_007745 [Hymenolepis weldensis]
MFENFHHHVTPNLLPSNSPDLNPLDYYVWGYDVVEKKANKHPHNIKCSSDGSNSPGSEGPPDESLQSVAFGHELSG